MVVMALRELKIELTQRCPLACAHCSTDSHRRRISGLSEDLVLRLLREGSELGVQKVAFSGGEPLLVEYLPRVVAEAHLLGINSSVYTCGVRDSEMTPLTAQFATTLAECGLGRFIFSLYSSLPGVHNSVTRYQSFDVTVAALRNAVASGVPVELHFVAMQRNFRDLPNLVDAAAEWGVRRISVLRFVCHGRGAAIAGEDLTQQQMHELREIILSTRDNHPSVELRTGSPYNVLGIGITPCDAAREVLVVNHRAEIFPCDAFKNVTFYDAEYGSVLKRPLAEVWERSSFLNRVREELAARPGPSCDSCSEMHSCQSGCLAQKVIRRGWGDTSEPDPSCLVQIEAAEMPSPHLNRRDNNLLFQIQ